jgi:hypothetical protein
MRVKAFELSVLTLTGPGLRAENIKVLCALISYAILAFLNGRI